MTVGDDRNGTFGYATADGRVPKLVVVAIVWAVFGLIGLFAALLMRSSGFAVFGLLCVVAGGALYLGQRTRDQLADDERHPGPLRDGRTADGDLIDDGDDAAPVSHDTTAYGSHHHDDDILDAEFTEYFDYDQSPADQDDGTGYDDEEVAYQRYQADQWARESEAAQADDGGDDRDDDEIRGGEDDADHDGAAHDRTAHTGADDEHDDVARTSRIPTGGSNGHGSNGHGGSGPDDGGQDDGGSSGHAGSSTRDDDEDDEDDDVSTHDYGPRGGSRR